MAGAQEAPRWRLERIPTGIPNLDRVIGGGLSQGDLALVVGGPGSGKTVLAAQMAFHWAAQGRRVLWLVTLGESNEKFLAHLSEMSFFDRRQVGVTFHLVNVSRFLPQGLQEQLAVIRQTVRSGDYGFVVIVGFQSFRGFLAGENEVRQFLSELGAELALGGITLLVTADAGPDRNCQSPEFTIADCFIGLDRDLVRGYEHRRLQVLKLRGREAIGGWHAFSVDSTGVRVHPRIESVLAPAEVTPAAERQAMGVPGLDRLLDGGLLQGTTTLIAGSPGTGKGFLADHFLAEGLQQSQPCLHTCFVEPPTDLLARAERFGLPLRDGQARGLLHVGACSPTRYDADECAEHVVEAIEAHGIRRLVLEGVGPLLEDLAASGRTLGYLAALSGHLRAHSVTAVLTYDLPQLFSGEVSLPAPALGQAVANLILLRFAEMEGRVRRMLTIVKTGYTYHRPVVAEMLLEEGALHVVPHPQVRERKAESAPYYAEQVTQHEGERLRPEQRLRP